MESSSEARHACRPISDARTAITTADWPSRAAISSAGWTSTPIREESARLDLQVKGPTNPAGAPGGWSTAGLKLVTGSKRSLSIQTRHDSESDRLELDQLAFADSYGGLRATGRLEDLSGQMVANLAGTWATDWDLLSAELAAATDPNARISGKPRLFRLAGPLRGGSLVQIILGLDAEIGLRISTV